MREYKKLCPLQDGTTDGNMLHRTEPDILSYTSRILSKYESRVFEKSVSIGRGVGSQTEANKNTNRAFSEENISIRVYWNLSVTPICILNLSKPRN